MIYKRQSYGKAIYWMKKHPLTIKRYLRGFYTRYDWSVIGKFFWKNPIQARVILEDFQKANDKKIEIVFQLFHSEEGILLYIIGAKGAGKTCTAFYFAEYEHKLNPRTRIVYIGRKFDKGVLPSWCGWAEKIQDVANGTFGIIDEIGIQASARDFQQQTNKQLTAIMILARQKKIPLVVLTQDSRLGEVNVWRLKDIIIWKRSNTYEIQERDTGSSASKFWNKVRNMMAPRNKPECLFEFPARRRFIHFKHILPECWSSELSEIYKHAQFSDPREPTKEAEIEIKKKTFSKKIKYPDKIVIG